MAINNIKESLNEKIDAELVAFEQSTPVAKRDELFFSELEIKTTFQNALYNVPMSDEAMQFIMDKRDILHDMCEFFAINNCFRDSSDTMEESVYQAAIEYIENAEHDYFANRLYERVKHEYKNYIDAVKEMPPMEIIDEAYKLTITYDFMCSLIPEASNFDTEQLKALMSFENPLWSLYQEWQKRDNSYMDDLKETILDMADKLETKDSSCGIASGSYCQYDLYTEDGQEP